MIDACKNDHLTKEKLFNPTAQSSPSGNCQACLLGAGRTVLIATQNSPKSGE